MEQSRAVSALNGATDSSEQSNLIAALRFPDSILEVTAAARCASGHVLRGPTLDDSGRITASSLTAVHRFLI